MNTFQLTHWVALAERFDQLRFRRALTAMSVVPVDRQWLSKACGLSPQETQALLQALLLANALVVLPALIAGTSPAQTGRRQWRWTRLHRRLRRWWSKQASVGRPVNFDDLE